MLTLNPKPFSQHCRVLLTDVSPPDGRVVELGERQGVREQHGDPVRREAGRNAAARGERRSRLYYTAPCFGSHLRRGLRF